MSRTTLNEMQEHLPAILERVAAGEEFEVVRGGTVVAVLTTPRRRRDTAKLRLQELRAGASIGDVESPIDEPWSVHDAAP